MDVAEVIYDNLPRSAVFLIESNETKESRLTDVCTINCAPEGSKCIGILALPMPVNRPNLVDLIYSDDPLLFVSFCSASRAHKVVSTANKPKSKNYMIHRAFFKLERK